MAKHANEAEISTAGCAVVLLTLIALISPLLLFVGSLVFGTVNTTSNPQHETLTNLDMLESHDIASKGCFDWLDPFFGLDNNRCYVKTGETHFDGNNGELEKFIDNLYHDAFIKQNTVSDLGILEQYKQELEAEKLRKEQEKEEARKAEEEERRIKEEQKKKAEEEEQKALFPNDITREQFEYLKEEGLIESSYIRKAGEECHIKYTAYGKTNEEQFNCEQRESAIERAYNALVANNLATVYEAVQPETLRRIEAIREAGFDIRFHKSDADACTVRIQSKERGTNVNLTQDCKAMDGIIESFARDYKIE